MLLRRISQVVTMPSSRLTVAIAVNNNSTFVRLAIKVNSYSPVSDTCISLYKVNTIAA